MFAEPKLEPKALMQNFIREQIHFIMCTAPMAEFEQRLDECCKTLVELIGAEGIGGELKVFGLTPAQVFHLKALYEARTGKKAVDL